MLVLRIAEAKHSILKLLKPLSSTFRFLGKPLIKSRRVIIGSPSPYVAKKKMAKVSFLNFSSYSSSSAAYSSKSTTLKVAFSYLAFASSANALANPSAVPDCEPKNTLTFCFPSWSSSSSGYSSGTSLSIQGIVVAASFAGF
ncbi:hypothetical protein Droror1_Dr00012682 [Drosera rotundifolia]